MTISVTAYECFENAYVYCVLLAFLFHFKTYIDMVHASYQCFISVYALVWFMHHMNVSKPLDAATAIVLVQSLVSKELKCTPCIVPSHCFCISIRNKLTGIHLCRSLCSYPCLCLCLSFDARMFADLQMRLSPSSQSNACTPRSSSTFRI